MRLQVRSLASLSGLRIPCCREPWHRSQTRLGSGIALAPDPSHSLPHPSGSHKSILQVHDFLSWGDVHLCWILDSSYKWCHMVLVFVFLTHFTQYESLSWVPSMLLQMALCHSFLWLSSIPLCIYTTSSESSHLSMDIWEKYIFFLLIC